MKGQQESISFHIYDTNLSIYYILHVLKLMPTLSIVILPICSRLPAEISVLPAYIHLHFDLEDMCSTWLMSKKTGTPHLSQQLPPMVPVGYTLPIPLLMAPRVMQVTMCCSPGTWSEHPIA